MGKIRLDRCVGKLAELPAVGDEDVKASAEFAELKLIHGQLVDALRSRSAASRKILSTAKLKAAGLIGGLPDFYRRISRRSDHFLADPAEKDVSYAE